MSILSMDIAANEAKVRKAFGLPEGRMYILQAKDNKERQQWIEAIAEATENSNEKGDYMFVALTDEDGETTKVRRKQNKALYLYVAAVQH